MDIRSQTQLEMRRHLIVLGVPFRVASAIATSIFDRERMIRLSPMPQIGEVRAFETVRDWIDRYADNTVVRSDVEPLLSELFGPDQTVYKSAGVGIRTANPSGALPFDPERAATGVIRSAVHAIEDSILSYRWLPNPDRTSGIAAGFEKDLTALVVDDLIPHPRLPQMATDDHDQNLRLLIYEKTWSVLERIVIDESLPTVDRLRISLFFPILWAELQSSSSPAEVRQPQEAVSLLFTADTRCIGCGVRVENRHSTEALPERYVTGRCFHEFVSADDREGIWARPAGDHEDLAHRLLFVANANFGLSVEALRADVDLPRVGVDARDAFLQSTQDLTGLRLDDEDPSSLKSLGDLFGAMQKRLEPTPTNPYVVDRVSEIFEDMGLPASSKVDRSLSGNHPLRASCLGGELLKHFDDPDVARGKLAKHLNLIVQGRCPRCTQELDRSPAGSRATRCRCIPVCSECGVEEATDGVRIAEWPRGGRGFAGPRDQEELVQAAFNEWPVTDPSDGPAEGPTRRWSYGSWPHRILGQLPADGLRQIRRVGEARPAGDDRVDPIRQRVLGCLLGGAVGDALGGSVEFMRIDEIRQLMGPRGVQGYWEASPHKGGFTDDTQMTLWTAEGLIRAHQRWHGSDYNWWSPLNVTSSSYHRWLLTQGFEADSDHPSLGPEYLRTGWLLAVPDLWVRMAPGNTCLSALRSGSFGTTDEPINDSKGCGGVMRVAPAGFVPFDDYAFELGSGLAAITHGHATGYLAAGALAHIIGCLNDGLVLENAVESALELLRAEPEGGECVVALEKAVGLAREKEPTPETVESLGSGWVAEEALAIAVYCSLVADDFRSGVLSAVNHSGDSDSTGSITGQILGTMLGVEAIPKEWLSGLQLGAVVERVAHDFVDVFYEDKVLVNDLYPAW